MGKDAGFNFYGGAREFSEYHGEAILHGPAETGKTISALWKLHLCALRHKNASLVVARKTLASTVGTVLQTYQNKVLGGHPEAWGIVPYGGEKPQWFDYTETGARIWVAGLDKSSKILSAEHDIIYVNQAEELELDDWETITTRTTGRAGNMPYAQTIGDANPTYPRHWMYNRDGLRLFYSRHEENPTLYDQTTGEITARGIITMGVLDKLTGVRKQRLRYGIKAQAEGAIYAEYDEGIHRIYRDKLPGDLRRFVAGVDWGYRHPGSIQLLGVTGEGIAYRIAEYYHAGRRDDWWLEKLLVLNDEFGIEAAACDPAQPAYIDKFKAAGINAVKGNNAVVPGINAVKKRLAERTLFIVRDSLRERDEELVEAKRCACLADEFPSYTWDGSDKERPVKVDDDGLDALRYAVMHLDGGGEPSAGLAPESLPRDTFTRRADWHRTRH